MSDDLMNEIAAAKDKSSIIMVVGVGGAGGNAVNHMWNLGIKDVGFMVCNTDAQALDNSPVEEKVQLGREASPVRATIPKTDARRPSNRSTTSAAGSKRPARGCSS